MPETKYALSTDRPPEEKPEAKEAREAKGKEQEFLSAFFELCDIYDKLRGRKKQDIVNLVLDIERDWKEKTTKLTPAQEERLAQIEDAYWQTFDELDATVKRFFDSPYTQEIFKSHLGQEIHSLDEADQFRQKLLEPFYNKFKELEPQEKKGRRRVSPEVLQKQSDQALEQATVKDSKWNETLKKLRVLPGRHQPELIAYLKFNKSKDTQSLLLNGQPLDKGAESADEYNRFGMLEPLKTEEDLIKLEDQIKQAKMVLAKTKSTYLPLLEKAEKSFPKETLTAIKARREENEKTSGCVLTIPDALNPYREALLAGGIPEAQTPEKQETKLDLLQTLAQDRDSYQQAGLTEWFVDLIGLVNKLQNLSPEKTKIIKEEVKNGAIAIFMPGKDVQFNLILEHLTSQLKPLWIKKGENQAEANTYLEWDHFKNLIENKVRKLLADVPDRPYILLTQPSQAPDPRTCKKNVDEQKQELKTINRERRQQKRASAYSMNPHEYVALQKRFTERAPLQVQNQLQTLNPLDKNTWTRFIHLPLSVVGNVPRGAWLSDNRPLVLDWGNAFYRDPNGGFRLSVRVEI